MSETDRTAKNVNPLFHPASHYDSSDDVLNDALLSSDEKRVILSSWASDMYAVESHPTLREVPGIPHRLSLDDILTALKQLDDENDSPPRGGLVLRLPSLSSPISASSRHAATKRHRSMLASRTLNQSRWTRDENVRRYRRLLKTQLTDVERNFIERRLAEELQGSSVFEVSSRPRRDPGDDDD